MKKVLLIIGAGVEQIPAIKTAKKMGLYVVASDGDPSAPGFKYSDDFILASTYGVMKTARTAETYSLKKRHIEGVIAVASDVPKTVALTAKKLGVFGYSLEAAKIASDKILMKNVFSMNGVPVPEYTEVKTVHELGRFASKVGFPIVSKPADSRGARGVLKLIKRNQLEWAFKYSKHFSPSKRIIAEKFVVGPQISSESIIYDGQIFTPVLSDRNYEYLETFSPYIIENGGTLPSDISPSIKKQIDKLILKCANAMGIKRGTLKGDIVVSRNRPLIIEVAARLSGGYFCTDQIPLSTGVNIVEAAIKIALGESINFNDLKPSYNRGVAQRFFFPEPGKIASIKGLIKARKIKGVEKLLIYARKGDVVERVTDHTKRSGFVICGGQNRSEAIESAEKVLSMVKIATV